MIAPDKSCFWYLASCYSRYPGGLDAATDAVAQAAADLLRAGIIAYSPIVHTDRIAKAGGFDPRDHDLWLAADQPFMDHAEGIIVLCMDGWTESYGISMEIPQFEANGRRVVYMKPGEVPPELLALTIAPPAP